MNKISKRTTPKDVDSYLADIPVEARVTLEKLRNVIREIIPEAEEVISYQIPAYKYHGMLVGFAAFKNHCGFYLMSPALLKTFSDQLKGYDTSTGTIRFPVNKPLPTALVKKLVRARVKENEFHAEQAMIS